MSSDEEDPKPDQITAEPRPADERLANFVKFLARAIPSGRIPPCPVCATDSWNFLDVGEIRDYAKPGFGKQVAPVVQLTCKTCAYVLLFNAIQAGVVEKDPDPPAGTEQRAPDSMPTGADQ